MMDEYVQLKSVNDWGVEYYAMHPLNKYGSADAKRGISYSEGETVKVRWPNGDETLSIITIRPHSARVGDMGNVSDVSYRLPELACNISGIVVSVPLNSVYIDKSWYESHRSTIDVEVSE